MNENKRTNIINCVELTRTKIYEKLCKEVI